MPLTATKLHSIKPAEKTRRYSDEKGMYLEVSPKGGMYWRLIHQIRRSGSEIQRFQHRIRHLGKRPWPYPDPGLASDGQWRPCTTGIFAGKAELHARPTPRDDSIPAWQPNPPLG